jgi:hypothetical protein
VKSDRSSGEQVEKEAIPRKWWQWILIYPAFGTAIIGAVPTVLELHRSIINDVSFGHSADAIAQADLWRKNFECAKTEFQSIINSHNIEVGSAVCRSGDILLRSKDPNAQEYQYRWVSWSEIGDMSGKGRSTKSVGAGIISAAMAGETKTKPLQIAEEKPPLICQKWIGNNLLLRRYSTRNGCVDEVIKTANGRVVERKAARCDRC